MEEKMITTEFEEHQSSLKHYMRDIILGVNDGLVSIYLLVAGIVGAGLSTDQIAISALAATIAGAISMMAGEYISTKSQEEVYQAEIDLEKEHIKYHREHEVNELYEMFGDLGFEQPLLEEVVKVVSSNDQTLLQVMLALEFGIKEEERRSPLKAMGTVALLFVAGALPAFLPFFFISDAGTGLVIASILSMIALFVVGALKTFMTKKIWIVSGSENLLIGIIGAVISFYLGNLYGTAI